VDEGLLSTEAPRTGLPVIAILVYIISRLAFRALDVNQRRGAELETARSTDHGWRRRGRNRSRPAVYIEHANVDREDNETNADDE
jgi:hypothetical protein